MRSFFESEVSRQNINILKFERYFSFKYIIREPFLQETDNEFEENDFDEQWKIISKDIQTLWFRDIRHQSHGI